MAGLAIRSATKDPDTWLIFVVDSIDRDRVVEARDELHRMLNEVAISLRS